MTARISTVSAESAKYLCEQVNRIIRGYETSHVSIQVVTTVVPDNRSQTGSKIIYEAFIVHPA
ncbi:hypothetical protein QF038_001809 [Pseudarthrobacter sp. W1I19]|uniref:hypothetical protein n=1 Tax=Pseudarthrobacter sp. W1I19 TaxID=3042288 RepID=UPI00278AC093|nr:hypothetical protein [Pseudarthrobacter sp. W1I19]MDQ0923301.1 hypothetical protein [Pseudarthrobacter sp. W1I19]